MSERYRPKNIDIECCLEAMKSNRYTFIKQLNGRPKKEKRKRKNKQTNVMLETLRVYILWWLEPDHDFELSKHCPYARASKFCTHDVCHQESSRTLSCNTLRPSSDTSKADVFYQKTKNNSYIVALIAVNVTLNLWFIFNL